MIAYASHTGTHRNLDALRRAGWHVLVSATGSHRTSGFPYAIDSGAWTAHQQQQAFDDEAYIRLLKRLGEGAEWIALPDIVGKGHASLTLSLVWLRQWRRAHPTWKWLIPVQDGVTPHDLAPLVDSQVGIFVGGTTEWKLATLPTWGTFAKAHGVYLHVGRVNSARRIAMCAWAGADSFDGTSVTRYAVTLRLLEGERQLHLRQGRLWQ